MNKTIVTMVLFSSVVCAMERHVSNTTSYPITVRSSNGSSVVLQPGEGTFTTRAVTISSDRWDRPWSSRQRNEDVRVDQNQFMGPNSAAHFRRTPQNKFLALLGVRKR